MKKVLLFFMINVPLMAQWIQIGQNLDSEVSSIVKINNTVFAGTKSKGIFAISDETTWIEKNNGMGSLQVNTMTENNGTIAAGTNGTGVFFSDNMGDSWTGKSNGLTIPYVALPYIYSLLYSGNNIIAGGGFGIFTTTDNASNWTRVFPSSMGSQGLHRSTNYVYAGVGPTIYRSSDDGLSWNSLVTSNTTIKNFYTLPNPNGGDIIYVGSLDGIFISTDDGKSWATSNSGLLYRNINALVGTGQNLFAATENGGVYYTSDGAANWKDGNTGLPANTSGRALLLNNGFIYLGMSNGSVWKRDLADFGITAVNEIAVETPNSFELFQNYPNPFNPSTTIKYSVPLNEKREMRDVKLIVYDVLGNEIATLVNENQSAGNYEVKFDGSDLSSGVYFYKLQSGDFSQTKKLILMK